MSNDARDAVKALRLLADAIEKGEVEYVRSDVVREAARTFLGYPFPLPRRLSLFVEVSC